MRRATPSGRPAFATRVSPATVFAGIVALAIAATGFQLSRTISLATWRTLLSGDIPSVREAILLYSVLPRFVVSLLVGAALGLSSAVMQIILRNPLAEPATLGTAAGASLALASATLWAPGLLILGREGVALAGAALAGAIVFGLAWRQQLAALPLLLAGLIVSFYCGALTSLLALFNYNWLQGIFIWGTGSLVQNDWRAAARLAPCLFLTALALSLLVRPLSVMALDDERARSLGLSLRAIRVLALTLALILSAATVAHVGVVGFLGLAATSLARLSGARTMAQRLVWSGLLGATLLWLTDQCVQLLTSSLNQLPTGAFATLLGAPLLVWLVPRLKETRLPLERSSGNTLHDRPWRLVLCLAAAAGSLAVLAMMLGRGPEGWRLMPGGALSDMLWWRWPRMMASFASGSLLAGAGILLQRLSGNPMASPEILGLSSGAVLGVIAMIFAVNSHGKFEQLLAGTAGACVVLGAIIATARRASFSPERVLLIGVAVGSLSSGIVAVLMASGDPRMYAVMFWLAGSTYRADATDAATVGTLAIAAAATMPLIARWLRILPLGEGAGRSLGLGISSARLILLLLIAAMTAAPTLVVGPLSFIGLMAPHMARLLGLRQPLPQLAGAGILGGSVMLTADWLGQNLLFPYQLPAGLLAALVGVPYVLLLMWSRSGAARQNL